SGTHTGPPPACARADGANEGASRAARAHARAMGSRVLIRSSGAWGSWRGRGGPAVNPRHRGNAGGRWKCTGRPKPSFALVRGGPARDTPLAPGTLTGCGGVVNRTHPLFQFMPYGAPELLASERPRLSRASLVGSGAMLASFAAAILVFPRGVEPTVVSIERTICPIDDPIRPLVLPSTPVRPATPKRANASERG